MPKRTDIKSILIIGSGPIVIGQACEFDYSGSQACRILKKEGYRIILVNSNPATIMTDPQFADATYIEPLTTEFIEKIIAKEKPDALLPTLGGQTALNLAMQLDEAKILDKYSVEMIGVNPASIAVAEDRGQFKEAMAEIGLNTPISAIAHTMEEALEKVEEITLPVIVRPAYILGGKGTGIARTSEEFERIAKHGLDSSPIHEILIEQSIAGWKEYELELMRDKNDNQVVICSIENVDPMGVHTGDSITVAPAQTLTDNEYQIMRDAAFAVMSKVGVETGGSNVQFAVDPQTGEQVVIEMNPRVSRSSALASKATGFPIAKIAALLAVGYTLDEIQNDITKKTPASFEPSIDYVVTKIPRWTFEKFPNVSSKLGTQMQSVGEVMAIGRTFTESLQKGLRSLEQGRHGLACDTQEKELDDLSDKELLRRLSIATPERMYELESALRRGIDIEKIYQTTKIDYWFLHQINSIILLRSKLASLSLKDISAAQMKQAKQYGFSDVQLAYLWSVDEDQVRKQRVKLKILPTYKRVDTCGGEFAAETPYFYSTYEDENESIPTDRDKVIILGSGPNRIGQGIEFDYTCVHASFASSELDRETIMINCNPETVSTDYDTSDRLYFEPLTHEDVQNIIDHENPTGVIVSLGGQTPLKLAQTIDPKLVLGTNSKTIDDVEDRDIWNSFCERLGIVQPPGATVFSTDSAKKVAKKIGYPVLIRPSYVLGGRAMEVVYKESELIKAMDNIISLGGLTKEGGESQKRPVLIDRFLTNAVEIDLDLIRDAGGDIMIGGIMEHVQEAGVHSGDSACSIPARTLSSDLRKEIITTAKTIASELSVVGLLNIQFAIADETVYVLEANPRASRTVPFLAKATGVELAKIATKVMLGKTIKEVQPLHTAKKLADQEYVAVKEAVMPFNRFPESDPALGPEMKSTGEVMGLAPTFEAAYLKSQIATWHEIPSSGTALVSLSSHDKNAANEIAQLLEDLGFDIAATPGTAQKLEEAGFKNIKKVAKGTEPSNSEASPNCIDLLESGDVTLVLNSPSGRKSRSDGRIIRQTANNKRILHYTSARAALTALEAIKRTKQDDLTVVPLQELFS